MTDHRATDLPKIEALLDLARAEAPEPSADLAARVAAAGRELQPRPAAVRPTPARAPGFWRRLLDGAGGLPGLGGLAAAGLVGFAIGMGGLLDPAAATEGTAPILSLLSGDTAAGALLGAGND